MAKGYGMLAIILGHIYEGSAQIWLYSFHVPLFFFLSGYVFNPKCDFHSFILRKSKSIIVPYFCLGMVLIMFNLLLMVYHNSFDIAKVIEDVKCLMIQKRYNTIWFVACLFWLNIIFYLSWKLFKSDIMLALLAVALTVLGLVYYKAAGKAVPWNIDVCFTAFPFFCCGYFFQKYKMIFEEKLSSKKISVPLFFIMGTINVVCGYFSYKISGNRLDMFLNWYGAAPLTYLSAFAGIFAVIIFSRFFTFRPILYIGENSLLFMAWHQCIMIPIAEAVLRMLHFTLNGPSSSLCNWMYIAAEMLIIIVLLTGCNELIRRSRLKFMLGK